MQPVCHIRRGGVDSVLPMEWKQSVFTEGKSWRSLWVVATDDDWVGDIITRSTISGLRQGKFPSRDRKETIEWRIEGSPSTQNGG